MEKRIEFAIAAIMSNPKNDSQVLAVKRPATDDALPGVWGLPAVVVKDGELPEAAIRRIGMEKLSTNIKPVSQVGIKHLDRGEYDLILMDIKATVTGEEPDVLAAPTKDIKYIDQQWTSDLTLFIPAAKNGSVCTRILLESQGINWRQ